MAATEGGDSKCDREDDEEEALVAVGTSSEDVMRFLRPRFSLRVSSEAPVKSKSGKMTSKNQPMKSE